MTAAPAVLMHHWIRRDRHTLTFAGADDGSRRRRLVAVRELCISDHVYVNHRYVRQFARPHADFPHPVPLSGDRIARARRRRRSEPTTWEHFRRRRLRGRPRRQASCFDSVISAWLSRKGGGGGLTLAFVPAIERRRRGGSVSLAPARTRVRDTGRLTVSGAEWRAGRERESGGCLGGRREGKVGADSRGTTRVPRGLLFSANSPKKRSFTRSKGCEARARASFSLLVTSRPANSRAPFAHDSVIGIASDDFPRTPATRHHETLTVTLESTAGSARERDPSDCVILSVFGRSRKWWRIAFASESDWKRSPSPICSWWIWR